MSRPIPSGNTVRTVSISPARMSDSSASGSACSGTNDLLSCVSADGARGCRILAGNRARGNSGRARALLYRDGNGRNQEDEEDETEDAHRVATRRERREIVEGRLVLESHDEEEQERPHEPVGRPGEGAEGEEAQERGDGDLAVTRSEEGVRDPPPVELAHGDQV